MAKIGGISLIEAKNEANKQVISNFSTKAVRFQLFTRHLSRAKVSIYNLATTNSKDMPIVIATVIPYYDFSLTEVILMCMPCKNIIHATSLGSNVYKNNVITDLN